MPSAERTIEINRPAEEVFDYFADGLNNKEWRAGVLDIQRTSSQTRAGATYRQVLSGPGGRKIDGDYRINVYDSPRRLAFEVTAGPARPTGLFELTVVDASTTSVRFALELRPRGIMKLMTPMIAAQMRREVEAISNAKAILERRPA
jgi:uncharacterized protein YndB with AHSA1/START domain